MNNFLYITLSLIFCFQVLQVLAVDGDRGIDNEISYSIIHGPSDIFGIDSKTGVVYTQNDLDRESERSRESNGAFILGIRAREVGGRQLDQFVDTEVTIIIEVNYLVLFHYLYMYHAVVRKIIQLNIMYTISTIKIDFVRKIHTLTEKNDFKL